MQKKLMVIMLVVCLLVLTLFSTVQPISSIWLGLSHVASTNSNGPWTSTTVGAVGLIEAVKWGWIAGTLGATPAGGVVVGACVGL